MRIDGNSRIYGRTASTGKSASAGGTAFAPADGRPASRQGPANAPVSSAGIDALLALQSVDDATTGRRKAVRRGHALLDSLEEIRADLVIGRVSEGRLNRAVALLQQARARGGEALDAAVADIELRVRVELAKLGRFPAL